MNPDGNQSLPAKAHRVYALEWRFPLKRLVLAALLLLWPTVAAANPVALDMAFAHQVPDTNHVQVTFAYFDGMGFKGVESATRDGHPVEGAWAASVGVQADMGSGVESVLGFQYCDCSLQPGSHVYEIVVADADKTYDYQVAVEVGDGEIGAGGSWGSPRGVEMQGIDCVDHCNGETPSPDAGSAGSASQAGGSNTGSESTAASGESGDSAGGAGGCAVALHSSGMSGSFLALAAAFALSRRRRRVVS